MPRASRIQYVGDKDAKQHLSEVALLVVGEDTTQTLGVFYIAWKFHVLVLIPEEMTTAYEHTHTHSRKSPINKRESVKPTPNDH